MELFQDELEVGEGGLAAGGLLLGQGGSQQGRVSLGGYHTHLASQVVQLLRGIRPVRGLNNIGTFFKYFVSLNCLFCIGMKMRIKIEDQNIQIIFI